MKCDQAERSIHLLLDGEVRAVHNADVFQHLGECEGCRNFYERLAATNNMIARQRLVPEYIMARTSPQLNEIHFEPRQFLHIPRISTVALWLAIGVVILSLLSTTVTHESPTTYNVSEYSLSPEMR